MANFEPYRSSDRGTDLTILIWFSWVLYIVSIVLILTVPVIVAVHKRAEADAQLAGSAHHRCESSP